MLTHAKASSAGMCLLRLSYRKIMDRIITLVDPFFFLPQYRFHCNALCLIANTQKTLLSCPQIQEHSLRHFWCLLLSLRQRCFSYFPLQAKHSQFLRQQQDTISPCPLNARSKNDIARPCSKQWSIVFDLPFHFPLWANRSLSTQHLKGSKGLWRNTLLQQQIRVITPFIFSPKWIATLLRCVGIFNTQL